MSMAYSGELKDDFHLIPNQSWTKNFKTSLVGGPTISSFL